MEVRILPVYVVYAPMGKLVKSPDLGSGVVSVRVRVGVQLESHTRRNLCESDVYTLPHDMHGFGSVG